MRYYDNILFEKDNFYEIDNIMDKAFIENKEISAYEISLNYENEKVIRRYSKDKKLLCVDPNCKNRTLRYCYGDKKGAYFAHLVNTYCDYAEFDKNDNVVFKKLRIKLSHHFSDLGYNVEREYKLLKHHYSPIFCSKGNDSFVVEMGNSKTTIGNLEKLMNEYSLEQISVKWVVIGEQISLHKENEISFLKRFLLNESKNNDFILIDGDEIIQYRLDKKVYQLKNDQELYYEKAKISDLYVVNGELTINGFSHRFELWQKGKEEILSQELLKKQEQEENQEKQTLIIEKKKQDYLAKNISQQNTKTTEQRKVISECISKNQTYTCSKCGKKGGSKEFYMMHEDTGICWECQYGPERYQQVKKHRGW